MKLSYPKLKTHITKYLLGFLQAQLIVSLVSTPILVGWGLQASMMAFVGNLIFLPVLILFLILSSLVFFTQICFIPNGFLIKILEHTAHAWACFLTLGSKHWLFGFCKPSFWILLLIPIFSFLILYLIRNKSAALKTVIIFAVFVVVNMGLFIHPLFYKSSKTKSFENGKLLVTIDDNFNVKLIDNGFFSQRSSHEKLVNYEIKQFLIKNTGRPNIQTLILSRPGYRSFKAAQECCLGLNIERVKLPFFRTNLKKSAWREFFKLKETLNTRHIQFLRT